MRDWKSRPSEFRRLWGYSVGFYGVWVGHVGRRLGLFEALSKKSMSAGQLASATSCDKKAVDAWCSAAVSLGFIKSRNDKLIILPKMQEILLDSSSPDYLGGQFSYIAGRSLEYTGLQDLFKSGKTRDMSSTFEAIEQATDWDHYAFLAEIKNTRLHRLLAGGCKLLDVGCGTGTMIEKLHARYPNSKYIGVEPSETAADKASLLSIPILRQNGESMSFEDKFDIAYLGESLYAAADKKRVIANCFSALRKGGTIAIVEGLLPETDRGPESRLIMGMQLDFALQGHSFMKRQEMKSLLSEAGFQKIKFKDLGGSLYLVIAIKE